jgi:hypothetical protein
MSRNPYAPAVHAVLKPHGFAKIPGLEWRREADGYLDQIHLQSCGLDRTVTVNIFIRDLATKGLLERITAGIQGGLYYSVRRRIRSFVSVYDKWWARDDPEGPQEVAQLLRDHALPFLDSMHSDEAMISEMRRIIGDRWWGDTNARLDLALLLWRTGRAAEACETLRVSPKRIPENWKAQIEAVRRFVCETPSPPPPADAGRGTEPTA